MIKSVTLENGIVDMVVNSNGVILSVGGSFIHKTSTRQEMETFIGELRHSLWDMEYNLRTEYGPVYQVRKDVEETETKQEGAAE